MKFETTVYSLHINSHSDGYGYVEDGREIFDDEDDYEVQSNSKKRKSQSKGGRGSKIPDEPVPKKKSLKNFFAAQDKKEKEAKSVDDDNLLKNLLGEIEGSTSATDDILIAPKTHAVSMKKQPTSSEIEAKKYMAKFNKKSTDTSGDVSEHMENFIEFSTNFKRIFRTYSTISSRKRRKRRHEKTRKTSKSSLTLLSTNKKLLILTLSLSKLKSLCRRTRKI